MVENGSRPFIPKLETEPSKVTKILPKCCEFDNQIELLSEAYHLIYGGPKNLLNDSSNLAEIKTPMKNTLLHIAALHGNDDIVTHIVKHAPKLLFTVNKNNDSVLHVAARGGHISTTVKKLLASYANFKQKDIALAWLKYTGYEDDDLEDYNEEENMEDLLYFVTKKNIQGNTMLHEAMLCGDKKSIDGDNNIFKICELYKTEDPFGNSLSKCCYEDALDIVNQANKSVLYIAVENGYKDVVKLILEKCPENDSKPEGFSPVVEAIMKQNKEMLSIILKNKPKWIHSSDEDERLPLHYAASIGYLEGVELLFGICNCCTIQRDKYGYFPIHLASYGGHVDVVKKLLEYCPDPAEMLDTVYGHNILHIASSYGKYEVVHYILQSQIGEHHKMINQQDNNGDTPLHLAARSCHPTVVYYLVNHKRVNLDLVNKNNKTALDIVSAFYMLDRSSLRQYLTWLALKSSGAKQSPRKVSLYIQSKPMDSTNPSKNTEQNNTTVPVEVEEPSQQSETKQSNDEKALPPKKKRNKLKSEPPHVDDFSGLTENIPDYTPPKNLFLSKGSTSYKDRIETLLLVSTLIVTTSVAACFAVPGEAADGKANNLCQIMFQLFIIFITISLFSAISSTILLFWATLGLTELVTYSLNIVMYLLGIALISLSLAFMAGLYTVISELTWLANVFLVMTMSFVVIVIFLYMLLFLPSSSNNMSLRYISHYPYLFLASRAESNDDDDQEDPNESQRKKEDHNEG